MHVGATPEIFKNAAKLRLNMTEPEIILWEQLKMKPLGFKFRRQHPIHKYILDFYCHKKRLSIEIDGGYHNCIEQKQKDKERTNYLNSVDITEIRFTNHEVLKNSDVVLTKILDKLREGTL
ncbi:MAG: endonuclease domain-containing protein [Bacteroidetes bacterium]|nr:endonuclease domain-containing protein [Bacteroidota bacterium]